MQRHNEETLLYSFRGEATLELLQQRVTQKFIILQTLFKYVDKFSCLQYLSDVLVFQQFLTSRFSHRRSREEAQQMTVLDMLTDVQRTESPDAYENVKKAFVGF